MLTKKYLERFEIRTAEWRKVRNIFSIDVISREIATMNWFYFAVASSGLLFTRQCKNNMGAINPPLATAINALHYGSVLVRPLLMERPRGSDCHHRHARPSWRTDCHVVWHRQTTATRRPVRNGHRAVFKWYKWFSFLTRDGSSSSATTAPTRHRHFKALYVDVPTKSQGYVLIMYLLKVTVPSCRCP